MRVKAGRAGAGIPATKIGGSRDPLYPADLSPVSSATRAGGWFSRQESRRRNPGSDSPGSGTRLLLSGRGAGIAGQPAVPAAGVPWSSKTVLRPLRGFREDGAGDTGMSGASPAAGRGP